MYTGPSLRNLALSLVLHGSVVAALWMMPVPRPEPPPAALETSPPTEIRIAGHVYYVSQIANSQDSSQSAALSAPPARTAPRAAPRAAEAGKSPALPQLPVVAAPRLSVAPGPAPAPVPLAALPRLPEPARIPREQARAFVPPEVRPSQAATQTLIQPLSPPDVAPPPTPLPNFRITADISQMRKIPKPFLAPGRITPVTPQSPDAIAPAPDLVPSTPAPPGDPLTVFSLSDHPIPFSDKVVVPAGNIAQPPQQGAA